MKCYKDGVRVSSMEEYCVKEKKWRQIDTKLTSNKSGFGTLVRNGRNSNLFFYYLKKFR